MKLSEKNTAQLRKLQIQENLQTKNINQNIKLMKNKQLENFISDLEHKR